LTVPTGKLKLEHRNPAFSGIAQIEIQGKHRSNRAEKRTP
jgi:hypothetical protein